MRTLGWLASLLLGGLLCLAMTDGEPHLALELPGPRFLGFYLGFVGVTLGLTGLIRLAVELGPTPRIDLHDPYTLAVLNGGRRHLYLTALISLAGRRLLEQKDGALALTRQDAAQLVSDPVENEVLEFIQAGGRPRVLLTPSYSGRSYPALKSRLVATGALPGGVETMMRIAFLGIALAALIGLSYAKLSLALSRGHRNIGLLVILTLGAVGLAVWSSWKPRTTRGDRVFEDARELYAGLQRRLGRRSTEHESLAVAVFGLSVLSGSELSYMVPMLSPPVSSGVAGGGSSGDSSCGSSCSSSCSGGCGGGGGCGGCGS